MDDSHFDRLVKSLASPSRRAVFSTLTATLFGGALVIPADAAAAKRKRGLAYVAGVLVHAEHPEHRSIAGWLLRCPLASSMPSLISRGIQEQ